MVVLNDKYMRDNIDMTSFKFGGKIKVLGYITNKITTDATESSNISPLASYIPIALGALSFIIFIIIDSLKRNLEVMLDEHYTPYSKSRMKMVIEVLTKYNININDPESLDMLINEAKYAQIHCDYLAPLIKPFKTLGAITIPIIAFVAQKIGEAATQDEMITMAAQTITLILLIFSLIFLLTPTIKELLYIDYNKYNEFIYDMRQIKLFYAKEDSSSTN